ncbi:histidine kinase [Nonomuraea sp. NPDC049152]|uniref:sensor histidine kinase n=1 Tax=Nonomuraea sp. NPDC049152 TaxID=3154350 RepID=UPI0033E658A5
MRITGRLGQALWLSTVTLAAANAMLAVLNRPDDGPGMGYGLGASLMAVAFAAVGALVAARSPRNPMGWLLSGMGLALAATSLCQGYAAYALITRPGSLPGGEVAGWAGSWLWVLVVVPAGTFLPLLFPDGRPPSARWHPVAWLAAADLVAVGVCAAVLAAGFAPPAFEPVLTGLADFLLLAVPAAAFCALTLASAAASLVRYRRAGGEERQQLKWFGFSVTVAAAAVVVQFVPPTGRPDWRASLLVLAAGIPVAIGIAIFKYRLYDIDAVIHRTFSYTVLAGFITAVYLAVVVGVGSAVGARTGGGMFLPLIATAIAALGFSGVRTRAQLLADRLVHGARATPYETLSRLSERLATTSSIEEFLPSLARALADATGALRADVWVRVGGRLEPAASHPPTAEPAAPLDLVGDALPRLPSGHTVAEVRTHEALLGAIALTKPPGESPTATDAKLVADLAAHAAIAFRDVARAAELRESRRRIVTAQDAERRRLERDLHDGAQQNLVALALKLRLARQLLDTEPAHVGPLLEQLGAEAESALETVRDLARGVFPAILADKGLAPALRAHIAKLPAAAEADLPPTLGRFAPEIEAAVYFCCLEALQNAAKHAGGSIPLLRLATGEGWLEFSVRDSGPGFDPRSPGQGSGLRNMKDRLEAVGGVLTVSSAPGRGATVQGRVRLLPRRPLSGEMDSFCGEPSPAPRAG